MKKRIICLTLALLMLISLLPTGVIAASDDRGWGDWDISELMKDLFGGELISGGSITFVQDLNASETVEAGQNLTLSVEAICTGLTTFDTKYIWINDDALEGDISKDALMNILRGSNLGNGNSLYLKHITVDMDGTSYSCIAYSTINGLAYAISSKCTITVTPKQECTKHEPSTDTKCNEYKHCTLCGATLDVMGTVHTGNTELRGGEDPVHLFAPNKGVDGKEDDTYCADCGERLSEGKKLCGHTYKIIPEKASTCIEKGNIEYYECGKCGKLFDTNEDEIKKSETEIEKSKIHSSTHYVPEVPGTCGTAGIKEHYVCDICERNFSDEGGQNELRNLTIPKNPYRHETALMHFARIEPDCSTLTDGNREYYYCPVCMKYFSDAGGSNELSKASTVLTAAHKWKTFIDENGDAWQICTVCGLTEYAPCTHIGTMVKTAGYPATCTEDGRKDYWTCQVCGKKFLDEYGNEEITDNDMMIEKAGHDFSDIENALDKILKLDFNSLTDLYSYDGTYHWIGCKKCGRTPRELSYAFSLLGLDESITRRVYEFCDKTKCSGGVATCTHKAICATCGHEYGELDEHNYEVKLTPATCDMQGYTTYTCTYCGDSYRDNYTAALGHKLKGNRCENCGKIFNNPFNDVRTGSYYYEAVLWAYHHDPQITGGITDTMFAPDNPCTRAQVVTFLWRLAGKPEPELAASPFTDVQNTNDYYYKAVLWAYENGITTGRTEAIFDPMFTVTRQQFVTFLWRYLDQPEPISSTSKFRDVTDPTSPFYKAIIWAADTGVTTGRSADTFAPTDTCSRANVVTFIYRAMMNENSARTPVQPSDDTEYVASVEGGLYHFRSCSEVKSIREENLVHFVGATEAQKGGYSPCPKCCG